MGLPFLQRPLNTPTAPLRRCMTHLPNEYPEYDIELHLTVKLIGLYTPIKLFWAVCHLFPQRWRTLTYSVSGNHWPGGPRDMLKTTSARKFSSCVWSHLQDAYFFYKYVIFKHPFSLLHKFFAAATHHLQCESTRVKSNNMDGSRRHSKYMTMRRFPVSEKLPVSNHKKDILNM